MKIEIAHNFLFRPCVQKNSCSQVAIKSALGLSDLLASIVPWQNQWIMGDKYSGNEKLDTNSCSGAVSDMPRYTLFLVSYVGGFRVPNIPEDIETSLECTIKNVSDQKNK